MTSWLDELSGGDRKSVGRAREVAQWALATPDRLDEVVEGLLQDDPIVRSRCAHVLATVSKARPELVQPFKQRLLEEVAPIDQWEVREQLCQIVPRLALDPADVEAMRARCNHYLNDRSSIVRTCAMQALVDLLRFDPSHSGDVQQVIGVLTETGTAAMRARGRKLLVALDRQSS